MKKFFQNWSAPLIGSWILLMGVTIGVITKPQYDPDFWWSLRIGQLILFLHKVPEHLNYTYTAAGRAFIAQEWGSETLYAFIWSHGGMLVILLLMTIVTLGGIWLALLSSPLGRKILTREYLVATVAAVGILLVVGDATWGPRAQMFSFLGVGLVVWVLRRKWKSVGWRYGLVVVFWAWAQLHGGFALGLGFMALYLVGVGINDFWRGTKTNGLKWWWLAWFMSALAVMAGPNGDGVYVYIIKLLHDPLLEQYINEWQSPNFHDPRNWGMLVIILIILGGSVVGFRNKKYQGWNWNLSEVLIFAGSLFWAFDANRNIVAWGAITLPITILELMALGEFTKQQWVPLKNQRQRSKASRVSKAGSTRADWLMGILLGVLGIWLMLMLAIPKLTNTQNSEFSSYYPTGIATWVCHHPQVKRLWVPDGLSGWILAAVDPTGTPSGACTAVRVSFFGELVLMGKTAFGQELEVQSANGATLGLLQEQRVNAVVAPNNTALEVLLTESRAWKMVKRVNQTEIFVPVHQ